MKIQHTHQVKSYLITLTLTILASGVFAQKAIDIPQNYFAPRTVINMARSSQQQARYLALIKSLVKSDNITLTGYKQKVTYMEIVKNLKKSGIEGSPYLSDNFTKGILITTGNMKYSGLLLRYNIYFDVFEFKHPGKDTLETLNPDIIREVVLNGNKYIWLPYKNEYGLVHGFFKMLNQGKAKALAHYTVDFVPEKELPLYHNDTEPAKFTDESESLYVYFGDKPATRVSKKSELLDALPAHKSAIAKYIKKQRIKVRKEKDLAKVIDFYNTLK